MTLWKHARRWLVIAFATFAALIAIGFVVAMVEEHLPRAHPGAAPTYSAQDCVFGDNAMPNVVFTC